MSFKNKVVIVTGASSGIGAASALLFAKESANVVIVGRNEEKMNNVAAKCDQYGNKSLIIKADVSKEDEAKAIIEKTIAQFGRIDVLVNNAGFSRPASIFSENIMQVYDEVMNTNLRAIVYLSHLAAPHLVESKGNIVNISSIGSTRVPESPYYTIYCVSKACVDHFTRCLAAELAPKGVRVNVVNPGPVKTDITTNSGLGPEQSEYFWKKMLEGTALGRISEADEIADLVAFLASDKAKGITGSSFVSDNGLHVKS